jgi:hypothetical protein
LVEIEFRPVRKIVVVEARRYAKPEDLARAVSLQSEPPHYVKWCRGWAFKPYPVRYSNTETFAKEFLAGDMYTSIDYAKMKKFQPHLKGSVEGNPVAVMDDSLSVHSIRATKFLDKHVPEIPELTVADFE